MPFDTAFALEDADRVPIAEGTVSLYARANGLLLIETCWSLLQFQKCAPHIHISLYCNFDYRIHGPLIHDATIFYHDV